MWSRNRSEYLTIGLSSIIAYSAMCSRRRSAVILNLISANTRVRRQRAEYSSLSTVVMYTIQVQALSLISFPTRARSQLSSNTKNLRHLRYWMTWSASTRHSLTRSDLLSSQPLSTSQNSSSPSSCTTITCCSRQIKWHAFTFSIGSELHFVRRSMTAWGRWATWQMEPNSRQTMKRHPESHQLFSHFWWCQSSCSMQNYSKSWNLNTRTPTLRYSHQYT